MRQREIGRLRAIRLSQPSRRWFRTRAGRALLRGHNWMQLAKFSAVGASGYVINLALYIALLHGANFHYVPAATCSFLVAVTNNYTWNRLWTFRDERGHLGWQGLRFLVVALVAYGANLVLLSGLIALGEDKVLSQGIAVVLVTPLNFVGNKLWSFGRPWAASRRGDGAWVPAKASERLGATTIEEPLDPEVFVSES
jgi:putative flippase GtrA